MPDMFDPHGTLDFHLPPILDGSELHERAERAGLDQAEAVLRPEEQPEAARDDPIGVSSEAESDGSGYSDPATNPSSAISRHCLALHGCRGCYRCDLIQRGLGDFHQLPQ